MNRAAILALVALAGCTGGGAMHELVLPMEVPRDAPPRPVKGEPMRVGTGVSVPVEIQRVDLGTLDWQDGRAQLRVRWFGAEGLQLRLEAVGSWLPGTTVRALDDRGAPLHGDHWSPAVLSEWTSPLAPADVLILEFEAYPGDAAELEVVSATTRTAK